MKSPTFISDLGSVYCLHWNSVFQKLSTVVLYILFLISVPKSVYVALHYIWSTFFALFNDALFSFHLFIFMRKVKFKICCRIIAVMNPVHQSCFFILHRHITQLLFKMYCNSHVKNIFEDIFDCEFCWETKYCNT